MKGFSALICTHNGVTRLQATLDHLAELEIPAGCGFEVILMDNGSTDDTAAFARRAWRGEPDALRVFGEPRLGKKYAFLSGFREARFDYVISVDDDNWLAPDYLAVALDILESHSDVAALGGDSHAVYDAEPPDWFVRDSQSFAIGSQGENEGDITDGRGWVWGAGSVLRTEALAQLWRLGVELVLAGRTGERMMTADDVEVGLYLRELGWRTWYSPRLCIRHFMPPSRFNRAKFRSLTFHNGALDSIVTQTLSADIGRLHTALRFARRFVRLRLDGLTTPGPWFGLIYLAGQLHALAFEGAKIALVRSNKRKLLNARQAIGRI